jgi:hypothetical protein
MKERLILSIICVVVIFLCLATSRLSTGAIGSDEYSNKNYGISFTIPKGINLYTAENPGPLASQISSVNPIYLVNPDFTEENINLKVSEPISQDDLTGFKKMLDQNPKMNLPKYQRISVTFIKIGKQKNKNAVEHVFIMQGNILGKLRQITFAHRGKGFTFTCATAVDRFEKANQQFFTPLFASMDFK